MTKDELPPAEVLDVLRMRIEVLEGILLALDGIDEVNRLVAHCQNRAEAQYALTRVGFSEIQANHVLDLTIARGTAEARQQLADELRSLRERIDQ